ncbi:hypothetical protein UA08_06780 [Talaromyces atroroseus]|uniref:Uncharacterized protein n=1 Tax=Talaromyces atroroseus TaxID=1441469 RepID=A0A225AWV5_TALAT|nr:hypothetical protein UA08_06780 [Talaromyces atroroseus]OKL57977.1 hypothetical protein UA08_06780 [Talaromyces atroroseus]
MAPARIFRLLVDDDSEKGAVFLIIELTIANSSTNTDESRKQSPRKRRKTPTKPKQKKEKEEDTTNSIVTMVVGVDFGTTYSGFATVLENCSFSDVKLNNDWPGCSGYQEKAPSVLTYDLSKPENPKVIAWGYMTKSSEITYTWFKLGLAEGQVPSEHDDALLFETLGSIRCPPDMTFRKLVTDYLAQFYRHFTATLKKQSLVDTYSMLKFRFVLAVPAGWPDRDKQSIKDCAVEAGFGKRKEDELCIIEEPEAAAITALYSYGDRFKGANTLKIDTNVMIVDMGGGTVDLITYTIKQLKPLKVEEACVGSGAKCGSSTIDRQFLKFMRQRFGTEFTSKSEKIIGPKSRFMEEFEGIKRRFDERTETEGLRLQMNWDNQDQYDSEDGEVILKRNDIVEMFKPVIDGVTGLIQQQVESTAEENSLPITAIILCGGLAESEYIRAQLTEWCEKNTPDAEVIVPDGPWSSICIGAAMSGVKSTSFIKSKKARRSYGTVTYVPFNPNEHDEDNAVTLPGLGKRMEKMHWHVKRNDPLHANEKYRWLKKASIQVGRDTSSKGRIELFESDTAVAPTWRSDRGIRKLGDLSIDLSDTQASPAKRRKYSSNSWVPNVEQITQRQKIEVGQVILPRQNSVEFIARIGRKKVGEASFEYTPQANQDGYGHRRGGEDDEDGNPDFWLHRPFDYYNPVDSFEDEDENIDDDDD